MTQETRTSQPTTILRKVLKAISFGSALVITVLVVGHFAWKYSGSNQWEQEVEENGVKVYSLKAPGYVVKRFRGVTHVKTTMNRAVAAMTSIETQDCADWFPGCTSERAVQSWRSQDLSEIQLYRLQYPFPFSTRELLVREQASQDPQSKAVTVDFSVFPDALPQNPCCYRIANLHNYWRYTPLDNGDVEVEVIMNMDPGIPYPLFNHVIPNALSYLLSNLQTFLDKAKWQEARYEPIKEK